MYEIAFRALMLVTVLVLSAVSFSREDPFNGVFAIVLAAGFAYLLARSIARLRRRLHCCRILRSLRRSPKLLSR